MISARRSAHILALSAVLASALGAGPVQAKANGGRTGPGVDSTAAVISVAPSIPVGNIRIGTDSPTGSVTVGFGEISGQVTVSRAADALGSPVYAPLPARSGFAGGVPAGAPVGGARLSSGYGLRHHPLSGGVKLHSGVDLAAPAGTPIYATGAGVVRVAGPAGGYGLLVVVDHGSGTQTRYGHMSRIAVAAQQPVRQGDLLGFVGSTGRSTGPHVHYEVRHNGSAVRPW